MGVGSLSVDDPQAVVVIGAGPAGLMAAQVMAQAGLQVHVMDAMPSAGRKFLLAGRGGLNLTHSEPMPEFLQRYGEAVRDLTPSLMALDNVAVRAWAHGLGVQTFVGTSGRVFPVDMKAAPLLRAWLHHLRLLGVQFHMRHRWMGWSDPDTLHFAAPTGSVFWRARVVVLALGGGSWARLGSDGAWVPWLQARGVQVRALCPSNCGFDVATPRHAHVPETNQTVHQTVDGAVPLSLGADAAWQRGWSPYFSQRYAGQPFKSVALSLRDPDTGALLWSRRGEFVATQTGVEGSLVYAASAWLRETLSTRGHARFTLDLLPDHSAEKVLQAVRHPRGSRSWANHLKSRLGLDGIKLALLHEQVGKTLPEDVQHLAKLIKACPVTVIATRPLDEAISSAGGVCFPSLTPDLMLQSCPGVFCAGEMLDWEAPTGGYLLTACLATGMQAGRGVVSWLSQSRLA